MIAELYYVICDRCAEQSAPNTDQTQARIETTNAGWMLVRDGIGATDYCPRCAGTPRRPNEPVVASTGEAPKWVCPECEQGKHGNCDGWAWDFDADDKTQCQCPEVHP